MDRNLETPHLFHPPATRELWEIRASELRRRVLVSSGLWPLPSKTPLRTRVTSRAERDDFTVENVAMETTPGFWLCGSIFRPKGSGPFPGVLNAHGHWQDGRKQREADIERVPRSTSPPAAGRADLVSLAVNLARQGMLVFAYDMVGYNETNPFSHQRFGCNPENWLFGVSELGLQTWNSLRALDYLCGRADVDSKRIGATGASGGGSQVFLLAAIDQRVQVSVPVNMVSATMQGGCTCENAPCLRVGTDNAELAAVAAPRPQLLISCTGDWTANVPTHEGPQIRKIYDLYGAGRNLDWVQFPYQHNYNIESREAATDFLRRHLVGKPGEPERSTDLAPAELRVTRPPGATQDQLESLQRSERTRRANSLRMRGGTKSRETLRAALETALSVSLLPSRKPRDKGSVLLVGIERAPEIGKWAATLADRGLRVRTLALPPLATSRDALWNNFFTTYNRTPVGDRVQSILDDVGDHAFLIGVGDAGLWTLLARSVSPEIAPAGTAWDRAGFTGADAEYLQRLYVACLQGLGGLDTAIFLASKNRLQTFDGASSPATVVEELMR